MIMIHWTWLIFTIIIVAFLVGFIFIAKADDDWISVFVGFPIVGLLIAFILIWGGIFWW